MLNSTRPRVSSARSDTSSAVMCRRSGRGCTVMPPQPAAMQVSAALPRPGSWPPRALRSTAILLRLTLSTVMRRNDRTNLRAKNGAEWPPRRRVQSTASLYGRMLRGDFPYCWDHGTQPKFMRLGRRFSWHRSCVRTQRHDPACVALPRERAAISRHGIETFETPIAGGPQCRIGAIQHPSMRVLPERQSRQAEGQAFARCLQYRFLGAPKRDERFVAHGRIEQRQGVRLGGVEKTACDVECTQVLVQAFDVDAQRAIERQSNQRIVAAVRPVELEATIADAAGCR